MPERIQLKRTKGWRMPPNTVKVDRSSRAYGNVFRVDYPVPKAWLHMDFDWRDTAIYANGVVVPNAEEAVRLFVKYALPNKSQMKKLRGKNLACWCKPGDPCHADVLLEIANQP